MACNGFQSRSHHRSDCKRCHRSESHCKRLQAIQTLLISSGSSFVCVCVHVLAGVCLSVCMYVCVYIPQADWCVCVYTHVYLYIQDRGQSYFLKHVLNEVPAAHIRGVRCDRDLKTGRTMCRHLTVYNVPAAQIRGVQVTGSSNAGRARCRHRVRPVFELPTPRTARI